LLRDEEGQYTDDWYEDDSNPSDKHPGTLWGGIPRKQSSTIGRIPHNLRETLKKIYNRFWINEFTCEDIKNTTGFKKLNFRGRSGKRPVSSAIDTRWEFKCTQLRALHNYGAIVFTTKIKKHGKKTTRVWKLTGEAVNYFAEKS
jgi:hypothetical protein